MNVFPSVRSYDVKTQTAQYAHTLLYAVADPAEKQYHPVGYVDPDCCHLIIERLKSHKATDKRINVAMCEMLEQGIMPLPDVPMDDRTLHVAHDKLMLDFSGNTLFKAGEHQAALQEYRSGLQRLKHGAIALCIGRLVKRMRRGEAGLCL